MKKLAVVLPALALALAGAVQGASDGVKLEEANTNIENKESLQRGARMFVNYCYGCHSLQYMRYSRLAEDLELSEEMVAENLIFDQEKKIGDLMTIALDSGDAEDWLGAVPPDLSVVSRSRGTDWIYSFLKAYYVDESRPSGWNNVVFENTSMPHVLWGLQGISILSHGSEDGEGEAESGDDHGGEATLEQVQPGTMSAEEYDAAVLDLVNFLEYAGEPAKLKRESLGVWVLLYLALFTFVAYLLKKEFWRDVH